MTPLLAPKIVRISEVLMRRVAKSMFLKMFRGLSDLLEKGVQELVQYEAQKLQPILLAPKEGQLPV